MPASQFPELGQKSVRGEGAAELPSVDQLHTAAVHEQKSADGQLAEWVARVAQRLQQLQHHCNWTLLSVT
ncbi:MAG: hypothetical protein GY820_30000 [Gammaproteobacteria bacterium]|nr:hypothetical protein [Gammaproteobacteria bacterium]